MSDEIGLDLLERLSDGHREKSKTCPGCGQECSRVAIVYLAYTFRACDCAEVEYKHLIEQLWHVECLQSPKGEH